MDVHHAEGVAQGVSRGRDPGLPRLLRVRGPGREGLRYLAAVPQARVHHRRQQFIQSIASCAGSQRVGCPARSSSSSSKKTRSCAGPLPTFHRPTCRENGVPACPRVGRRRQPCRGDLPGAQPCSPALLPLARDPGHRCRTHPGIPCQRPPRRLQVRLPVPGRRSPRNRRIDGRTYRLGDLLTAGLEVGVREETRQQRQEARSEGPRRVLSRV